MQDLRMETWLAFTCVGVWGCMAMLGLVAWAIGKVVDMLAKG